MENCGNTHSINMITTKSKTLYIYGGPKDINLPSNFKGYWFVSTSKSRFTSVSSKDDYLHKDGMLYSYCGHDGFFKTRKEARDAIKLYKSKHMPVETQNTETSQKDLKFFVAITVHDIYGSTNVPIPKGYELVRFGIPKHNDIFLLTYSHQPHLCTTNWLNRQSPRLIVKKINKKIKVGDNVLIVGKPNKYVAWGDTWMEKMNETINTIANVRRVNETQNMYYLDNGWVYPRESLELQS